MATFKWFNGRVPKNLKVTQVYGIAFDDKGRVLLKIEDGKYGFVGGKPEKTDATKQDTLKREFLEEVNITIKNIHMLGYQLVDEHNGKPPYAQVRMIAKINKVFEAKPDIDNGKLYARVLTSPQKAIEYLNYGLVGEQQVNAAFELAKNKYGFVEFCEEDQHI